MDEPTKILLASGHALHPIGQGGGETSAHDLLTALGTRGVTCHAQGAIRPHEMPGLVRAVARVSTRVDVLRLVPDCEVPVGVTLRYRLGYRVALSTHDAYVRNLWTLARRLRAPIWAQGPRSQEALDIAHALDVPSVFYIHNGEELGPIVRDPSRASALIANSRFVQRRIRERFGLRTRLLYPTIDVRYYDVPRPDASWVTMVNPIEKKGVETFLRLAERLPRTRFVAVEGWGTPREIQRQLRSLRNVRYLTRHADMRDIYRHTRVLLVPSVWDEPFARVIVEAQASGIPVLASPSGGIPEALGQGGVLVERRVERWCAALAEVERDYAAYAAAARANATRFDAAASAAEFLAIVGEATEMRERVAA